MRSSLERYRAHRAEQGPARTTRATAEAYLPDLDWRSHQEGRWAVIRGNEPGFLDRQATLGEEIKILGPFGKL